MGYIYKISNKVTGKHYIGGTCKDTVEKRWTQHISTIQKGEGCPLLGSAIRKYGVDNFTFEVLIICFDEDVFLYEPHYIKKYGSLAPNGYNATPGGIGGGFHGKKHSKESIQKFSESLKKHYREHPEAVQELRERMNRNRDKLIAGTKAAAQKRREDPSYKKIRARPPPSEKTKNKIRESVNKYYESMKNDYIKSPLNKKKHSEIMSRVNGIKIAQHDLNGTLIREYDTIKAASAGSGVKEITIGAASRRKNNVACGFIWRRVTT
jgi:group I intron endonuclease